MDGIIIMNKPKACTSHDIVARVKRALGEKIGHTGTLDPNATGVLPLLIGKGTKMSQYLIEHDKTYEVVLQLGIKTDTADVEGKIVEQQSVTQNQIEEKRIKEILQTFLGKTKQIPPMYSAIKVKGKKLYEYARNQETIEILPREIEIYQIQLYDIDSRNKQIHFEVSCSKGTYIRTLCEDIANKLGTIGYMKELKRTCVGDFTIQQSITIEELEENSKNNDYLQEKIISIEQVLKEKEALKLEDKLLDLFYNGVQLTYSLPDGLYRIYNMQNTFIGTGTIIKTKLKRDVVL